MVADYRSQLNVVGWSLCSVAIIVVGARSYCRYFLIHSFGLDDALMVLALVSTNALTFSTTGETHDPLGYWHCHDSPGICRRTPWLRSTPRRYQGYKRS